AMRDERGTRVDTGCEKNECSTSANAAEIASRLRRAMWEHAGVVRNRSGLQAVQQEIPELEQALGEATTRQSIEARNLLGIAGLIVRSALAREESRGAHFRSDFPQHNEELVKHSII